jgi:hypothetical protein
MRGLVLALALALALSPLAAAAQEGPDCAALLAGLQGLPGYAVEVPAAAPEDGACVLDGARLTTQRPGWPEAKAERVRIAGGAGWISLEVRGLRLSPRLGERDMDDRLRQLIRLQTVDLTAQLAETEGGLEVTAFDLALSGGTRLTLTARVQGAGLALDTVPGGALTDLALEWRSDGRLLRPVMDLAGEGLAGESGASAVDAARDALAAVVKALPGAALSDGAREALAAMVADLPQGRGRLDLRLTAPDGIGAAKLGLLALSDAPLGPEALERLLSGATISADWQPGLQP